jgi:hypothetical protein
VRDDGYHIKWEHIWDEFIKLEDVEIQMCDIKSFCQSLLESMRKYSDHPHLISNAFEGSLGSAEGRPIK